MVVLAHTNARNQWKQPYLKIIVTANYFVNHILWNWEFGTVCTASSVPKKRYTVNRMGYQKSLSV